MINEKLFWSFARLRVYIYHHNQNMIVSGAVQPKINHNFFSRESNYAPLNYVKSKRMLIQFHLFWNWSLLSFTRHRKFAKTCPLFLIERRAPYRRFAPIGQLKNNYHNQHLTVTAERVRLVRPSDPIREVTSERWKTSESAPVIRSVW
jgi:hypothetical protein